MPGLAFLHFTSRRVARAAACCVIVAILARSTESALGDGQPYLVKDINPAPGLGGFPEVYTVINGKFLLRVERNEWLNELKAFEPEYFRRTVSMTTKE